MNSEGLRIHSYKLTAELLEAHPVWGAFEEDDSEFIRPITSTDPYAEDCDPLTVKAEFQTCAGMKLTGCVVVDRAFDRIYLVEIFVHGLRFGFNIHLGDLAKEDLAKIQASIGNTSDPIFPLRYRTSVPVQNGRQLEGMFSPFV